MCVSYIIISRFEYIIALFYQTMTLTKNLTKDIIEWDVENWKHALYLWNQHLIKFDTPLTCLELGGRKGGCSLWLANAGHHVICSDLTNPEEDASKLHAKYELSGKVEYQAINATDIPYENHFDVIVLKSIIGGVSHSGQDALQAELVKQCYKALKPGGKLMYAENLAASKFHQFMRKKFVNWGDRWNYVRFQNVPDLFSNFKEHEYTTRGFLGTFGRTEAQRNALATVDRLFNPIIPKNMRYLVYGVAQK